MVSAYLPGEKGRQDETLPNDVLYGSQYTAVANQSPGVRQPWDQTRAGHSATDTQKQHAVHN